MTTSDVVTPAVDYGIIDEFFAARRAKHGDLRMEATTDSGAPADGGDAAGSAPAGDAPAADPAATSEPASAADTQPGKGSPVDLNSLGLTPEQQAAINALIGKRVGETKTQLERQHKTELQQLQEMAGKSEAEKAALQLEQAQQAQKDLQTRLVAAEAKAVLASNQVAPEHHAAVLKLAELPTTESGEVDLDKVAEAVTKTLETYPMFKPAPKATETAPKGPVVVTPGAAVAEGTPPAKGKPASLADAVAAYWQSGGKK